MTDGLTVEVTGLSVSYRQDKKEIPALQEISFAIPAASTCAILGPSGCGKSTLLYVLAGLHSDYQGTVAVKGEPTLILQDYGLLPWKTVFENVQLGLEIRGVSREQRADKVEQVLSEMGLWEMRDRYPSQLSGGQRQRVGIARSLALDPNLLLMDEPFSALDAINREKMQRQMLDIWQTKGITIILVTHSIEEAVFLGQKIIVLTGQPGQLLDIVDNPRVGEPGYRKTTDFHQLTSSLREKLIP